MIELKAVLYVEKYFGAGGSGHGETDIMVSKVQEVELPVSPYLIDDSIFVVLVVLIAILILWRVKKSK